MKSEPLIGISRKVLLTIENEFREVDLYVVNAFVGDKLIIISPVAYSIEYYDNKLNTLKGK